MYLTDGTMHYLTDSLYDPHCPMTSELQADRGVARESPRIRTGSVDALPPVWIRTVQYVPAFVSYDKIVNF